MLKSSRTRTPREHKREITSSFYATVWRQAHHRPSPSLQVTARQPCMRSPPLQCFQRSNARAAQRQRATGQTHRKHRAGWGVPGHIEGAAHGEHISWRRGRRPRASRPCTAATPAPRMAISAYFPGTRARKRGCTIQKPIHSRYTAAKSALFPLKRKTNFFEANRYSCVHVYCILGGMWFWKPSRASCHDTAIYSRVHHMFSGRCDPGSVNLQ